METFIACVRAEPCLWNTLHHEYREVPVRDAAWQRIVNKCKNDTIPSVKVARSTWRRIRDNHREALKRAMLGQNKLLPAQITTWKYAKAMQFLEPHMKYRITENIEPEATDEVETETPEPDVTTSHSAEPLNLQQSSATQGSPARKRFCAETNDSLRPPQHDGDALESFFNYMLKSTREMPSWMQTQVKKKIFAVLIEAEEQISSNDNNDNNDELDENRSTLTHIKTEVVTEDSCDFT